jgi:hypothetical protein
MYLESQRTQVVGVDVFIAQKEIPQFSKSFAGLELKSISNRGTKVWPAQDIRFELCDLFQCRFMATHEVVSQPQIVALLQELNSLGFDFVHVEKLLQINGKIGFSEGSGT